MKVQGVSGGGSSSHQGPSPDGTSGVANADLPTHTATKIALSTPLDQSAILTNSLEHLSQYLFMPGS